MTDVKTTEQVAVEQIKEIENFAGTQFANLKVSVEDNIKQVFKKASDILGETLNEETFINILANKIDSLIDFNKLADSSSNKIVKFLLKLVELVDAPLSKIIVKYILKQSFGNDWYAKLVEIIKNVK